MKKKEMVCNILGCLLIVSGFLFNEIVFSFLFGGIGFQNSVLDRGLLYAFNVTCIIVGYIFLRHKQWRGNVCLLLASLFISFFVADLIASRFIGVGFQGEKRHIKYFDMDGHCYPHVKKYKFPIKQMNIDTGYEESCVIYDITKRNAGFYPGRSKRAVIVGDSFTIGEGVMDEETLGYILGGRITDYNFINLGRSGTDIIDIYQAVSNVLKENKNVKEIIYFFNINDALMDEEIASAQKFIIDFQNVRLENMEKQDNFLTAVLLKSYIYRLVDNIYSLRKESELTIQNYLDIYSVNKNKEQLGNTLMLMLAMDIAAKRNGVRFQIVLYPLLYKTLTGGYPFESIHQYLLSYCEASNIRCIDAYPAFEAQISLEKFIVHPLDYHPNSKANYLVVDYLIDKLNL